MSIFDSLAKFFFGVRRDLELPEEIWAEIFRLVCCLSELDDAPRLLSFPTADSQKLLATRMNQRNVILVCKAWYRMALPCIYSQIAIFDPAQLHNLAEALRKNTSLGRYATRLDILIPRHRLYIDEHDMVSLTTILQHLRPNLRVLTLDCSEHNMTLRIPASLPHLILQTLPELKVLYTPMNVCFIDDDVVMDDSSLSFPPTDSRYYSHSLRTASFPMFSSHPGSSPNALTTHPHPHSLSFPSNLSQIYIAYNECEHHILSQASTLPSDHLHSITSLLIGKDYWGSLSLLTSLGDLLPNLRYVGLQTTLERFNQGHKGDKVRLLASSASTSPSSLSSSSLTQNPTSHPSSKLILPDAVHTFGISFLNGPEVARVKDSSYHDLCFNLTQIQAEALQLIRFGAETVADIQRRPEVKEMMNKVLEERGWRLEAGDVYI